MKAYTKIIQVFDPKFNEVNEHLEQGWLLISITVKRVSDGDLDFTDYPTYILGMPESEE